MAFFNKQMSQVFRKTLFAVPAGVRSAPEERADAISSITREISDDRAVSAPSSYCGAGLIRRPPASVIKVSAGIIAATQATLADFSDRALPGEDVIRTGMSTTAFLSSHRWLRSATRTGTGRYGAPMGPVPHRDQMVAGWSSRWLGQL